MTHAIIIRDGFAVPLIGIPESAVIDECDLCGDVFGTSNLKWDEQGSLLCSKCRSVSNRNPDPDKS